MAVSNLRLSTGLKVSSGLDGPNYFAANGLRQRALGLISAKDEQFKVISTVKAADKAAESIESLIQQAKALAQTARNTTGITTNPQLSKALASQFDTVISQINAVAKDSAVRDSNLATGRSYEPVVQATRVTGIDDMKVTNATHDANFGVRVYGDGGIKISEEDKSKLETTLGIKNIRATGFSSASRGDFSDISVSIRGRQGGDRVVTVSDGHDSVSQKILYSDLTNGDQHFSAGLVTGTRLDFDLNKEQLDDAVGSGNSVSLAVRKRVDLNVAVTEAQTRQLITRNGTSDTEHLADGANAFRFGDATYRLKIDQARVNLASYRDGPVISDTYGAAAAAVVGKPVLVGTPGSGTDQAFRLSVVGSGLRTATATSTQLQANAVPVAQVNRYFSPALAFGQSATITIDGTTFTSTAGAGGLTAAQVNSDFVGQLGGAGLQVSTSGLPANGLDLSASVPGTPFASAVGGGVTNASVQINIAAVAQINSVSFTPTVETGETYGITINGQTYSHTSVSGDTIQTIMTTLASQITPSSGVGGDPSVTAAVNNGAIDLTAKVAGTAFTQSANVINLPLHLDATLNNGTVSNTQNVPATGAASQITFSGAFGNSVTGVTLTFDVNRLADAARNKEDLGFDVRFAQQGEAGNTSVNLVGREATRGDVKVTFDSPSDSSYVVQAQNLYNDGLGLDFSANDWRDLSDIDKAIADCDNAQNRVRSGRSSFGVSLGVLSTRENFTDRYANVLNDGADKLTLIDQAEEGATLLAEQTRQQIAMTSLSIANQFYASMLKQMLSNAR